MESGTLDTTREARFESMRRQSRSAQVLRRHEDLRKQCEREMLLHEKAKRLTEAHCRQSQLQYMIRINALRRVSLSSHHDASPRSAAARRGYYTLSDVVPATATSGDFAAATTFLPSSGARSSVDTSSLTSLPASSPCDCSRTRRKARFLFRVLHRNGKELYIRDADKARESRQLLNCVSSRSVPADRTAVDVGVTRDRVSVAPRGLVAK